MDSKYSNIPGLVTGSITSCSLWGETHIENLPTLWVICKQQLEPVCLSVREFQVSTILSQLRTTRCYRG